FADLDYQVSQLQKISDQIGRKLQFNVNKELNKIVVKIVDPNTDQVIKEIPSPDIQKLQLRLKEALGLLVDEKI
ncbi:MAG: flagellar protein FlaG, partial [Spirochaetaceae bacterium]|nr:flagellar protein FlaG [Spirochaetaceae bacterium]